VQVRRGELRGRRGVLRGRAVQVDPIKPTLKAPGTKRLKVQYDEPLLTFAINFSLRRYNVEDDVSHIVGEAGGKARYISSTEIVCVAPIFGPASQAAQYPPGADAIAGTVGKVGRCRLTLRNPR